MRILFMLYILLLSFSPLCYGREIFEGGYSGNYAKDGYQPDITVDVFTGEAKMTQRQKEQVYSAFAFPNSNDEANSVNNGYAVEEQPVYLGPISDIITTQADKSADDNSASANDNQNSETDKNAEKSEEGE
jgi:hypothetical protein